MGIVSKIVGLFTGANAKTPPRTVVTTKSYGRSVTYDPTKALSVIRISQTQVMVQQAGQPDRLFDTSTMTIAQLGDWPTCGAKPAPTTRTATCGAGFTGSWQQTRDWIAAPYPVCWTQDGVEWTPAAPPAGACTPVTPPPGRFRYDLSNIRRDTVQFSDFIGFCNRQDEPLAFDLIIAYSLTGIESYRTRALALIDAQVNMAIADIAAGRNPDLTGDDYLYCDNNYVTPAAFCIALGNPSAEQIARWRSVYDQALFNIWNFREAKWGSRLAPWDGWSVDNPYNNYNMHFMRTTTAWALATSNSTWLDILRNDLWPRVVDAMSHISGGGSLEGSGYGYAYTALYDAMKIWRDSGEGNLFGQQIAGMIQWWAHASMPGLTRFLPTGDQPRESEPKFYDYYRALILLAVNQTMDGPAAMVGDWMLSNMTPQHRDVYRGNFVDDLEPYIVTSNPPLSLTFRAAEQGMIAARTSWNASAIGVWFIAGDFSESHMGQEQGQFTMWGGGTWLAATNNIWSRSGIHQTTIDKNVVAFYKNGTRVDQRRYVLPEVVSYVSNPATGETHVVLDLSVMYANDSGVRSWVRQFDFVDGILTIKDIVDLASGTTAVFQLNTPAIPSFTGITKIVAGHLTVDVAGATGGFRAIDMQGDNIDDYRGGFRSDVPFTSTLTTTLRFI